MATSPCVKCQRSLVVLGAPNAILLSWFNIVKSGDEKSNYIEIIWHHMIVIALIGGTLLELVDRACPAPLASIQCIWPPVECVIAS